MLLIDSTIIGFILSFILSSVQCLFDQCNHKIDMKASEKLYINSPYYPGEYPVGTSCRYVISAPLDYHLKFSCDIKLNTVRSYTNKKMFNAASTNNKRTSKGTT